MSSVFSSELLLFVTFFSLSLSGVILILKAGIIYTFNFKSQHFFKNC